MQIFSRCMLDKMSKRNENGWKMDILRKWFFVFDLAMFGVLLFAIRHATYIESAFADAVLNCALLLRIGIPFLLYRKEKATFWPIVVFTLVFGFFYFSEDFYNLFDNMRNFPAIVMGDVAMRGVFGWVWLMPLVVYVIQLATKRVRRNGYPWYYMIGGIVFKDKAGKLFLSMAISVFVAVIMGYEMQDYLSFYALVSLPLVGYYFWNMHLDRTPRLMEYAVLFIGLYVFDKAQYRFDGERIALLAASAIIVFAVCTWMAYKTKTLLIPILAFLLMAFGLPTLSLGYNVYQSIDGARYNNLPNAGIGNGRGYMYIMRDEVIDGKQVRLMGVRNRYHTTIPCEYKYILPANSYSPFAKCVKENGESAVRSIEWGDAIK